MKTDQLLYFLETARLQHIGKASRILNISPSAISHSISALEEELGHPLFEKVGKNIFLTPHGKKLSRRAEEVLRMLTAIKDELQSDDIEFEGKFRIAATHGLLHHWIIPKWARFQSEFPRIEVEFFSLRSAQVVELVGSGQLDFGICYSPVPNPQVSARSIKEEKLLIAVRPGHPVLRKKNLSEYPCAAPKAFQGIENCEDHPALRKAGIVSNVSFIFDSYDVAAAMLLSSEFWALMPETFVKKFGLKEVAIPGFHAPVSISCVTPKNRPLPKPLGHFLDKV